MPTPKGLMPSCLARMGRKGVTGAAAEKRRKKWPWDTILLFSSKPALNVFFSSYTTGRPVGFQPDRFYTVFFNPALSVLGGIFLGKKLQVISTIGRGAGGPHPCLKKLGKLIWFLQAQDSLTTKTTTTSITIM